MTRSLVISFDDRLRSDVHRAMFFRDRIRHKDKDPSFSAKQARTKDVRIHKCSCLMPDGQLSARSGR
jgi:hypothetical protein